MPIDTTIEGDPESVRASAHWVRDSLASRITHTASQIYTARNRADAGWRGDAAEGFRDTMTRGASKADEFGSHAMAMAQSFDDVAAALHRAQTEMERIRGEASSAGLTVDADVIADPPAAPTAPGPAPTGDAATPEALGAHNRAVAAQNAHTAKAQAYDRAEREAETTRGHWKAAVQEVNKTSNEANQNAFLSFADITAGTTVAAAAAKHSSILMKQSLHRTTEAARLIEHAKAIGASDPTGMYQNLDAADSSTTAASTAADNAAKATRSGKSIGLKAGGVLAAAGIAYDISQSKPVDQAIVSGIGGFGISVAGGAIIGSLIPIPVLGTAVGAIGGAAVGVFTSGAIDSLYENGVGAVGDAVNDGIEAVKNTGEAVFDAGKAVGDTIADAGEAAGGAIKDAWNAIF